MRDEFSEAVKKALGARVAYRCSFPGCNRSTIGPGHDSNKHIINLGEAAHIYAASENGPRPNPNLTSEEKSSIDNGIWMCRSHARFIDSDSLNYSADTLKLWKQLAEERAYRILQDSDQCSDPISQTLVGLSSNLIFSGSWIAVAKDTWTFEINHFVEGSYEDFKSFAIDFSNIAPWNKFVAVESQGDGRQLNELSWKLNANNKIEIVCHVLPKSPRTDPNKLGGDLALGDDLDIVIDDNDFAIVNGIDSAIQTVRLVGSSMFGDYFWTPQLGSEISRYFFKYGTEPEIFNRFIKLEIIRLLSVSVPDPISKTVSPTLDFINRIIQAKLLEANPDKDYIVVGLGLEWGNNEYWNGDIKFHVRERVYEEEEEDESMKYWKSLIQKQLWQGH